MNKETIIGWSKVILIILAVMAVGLFMVNQFLLYKYKSVFLQTPCELCISINKQYEECFENHIIYKSVNLTINYSELNSYLISNPQTTKPENKT